MHNYKCEPIRIEDGAIIAQILLPKPHIALTKRNRSYERIYMRAGKPILRDSRPREDICVWMMMGAVVMLWALAPFLFEK